MGIGRNIEREVPDGFTVLAEGEKIVVARRGWEETMARLARMSRKELLAASSGAAALTGRGRPLIVGAGADRVVIRRYYHGGIFRKLTGDRLAALSRPLRELAVHAHAEASGLSTPRPVGLIMAPGRGWGSRAEYISAYLPDSVDLLSYCLARPRSRDPEARREWRRIAARAGALIAALHRSGISHPDLQLKNVLLQTTSRGLELSVLDFDRAVLRPALSRSEAVRNLLRFYRSYRKMRMLRPERDGRAPLRFLFAYEPRDRGFRRRVVRAASAPSWTDLLHRLRWKLSLKFTGRLYPRPFPEKE